jgi:FKBP-type peptidyl-prolyl cis-trans isomerase
VKGHGHLARGVEELDPEIVDPAHGVPRRPWVDAQRGGLFVAEMKTLQIEKIVAGSGAAPRKGQLVTVHYTGWLTTGEKFDSSVDRDEPFSFVLGARQVIGGWDQGVAAMIVGDKVKLTIPPELGYGAGGYPGAIPPNATLVFDVELLAIG